MNSLEVTSSSPQDLKTKMKPLMKNCSINLPEAKTEQFLELYLLNDVHRLNRRTETLESCHITAKEIVIKGGQKNFCIFIYRAIIHIFLFMFTTMSWCTMHEKNNAIVYCIK